MRPVAGEPEDRADRHGGAAGGVARRARRRATCAVPSVGGERAGRTSLTPPVCTAGGRVARARWSYDHRATTDVQWPVTPGQAHG